MQLVKLITHKRIKTLYCLSAPKHIVGLTLLVAILNVATPAFSQDNSPYSRFGIGDLVPPSHIANRGMGGISAGIADYYSINFNNPASFSSFEANKELRSKKLASGRAILDIGMNFEGRTLSDPTLPTKFKASNALFSYVQIGMPLKKNWGLSFGIRPISRISYKLFRRELLTNPQPPYNRIDSALTRFEGDGGSYLVSVGTGFGIYSKVKKGMIEKLSLGITGGYLFGRKDYQSKRQIFNDTISYVQAKYENRITFGNLYFNTGMQYQIPINEKKKIMLTLGAYGSWGQTMNARQDIIRETFIVNQTSLEDVRQDSVYEVKDLKGKIDLPANYTVGFTLQKFAQFNKEAGWLIGVDYEQQQWDNYRIYGQTDAVQNKWELRVGAQFNPIPKRNYFSNVIYRVGFSTGPDYINLGKTLNQVGGSFGLGLPIGISRQAPSQVTRINLAMEYKKRGNSSDLLSDNMFRVSLGFSVSDLWFGKRKYE